MDSHVTSYSALFRPDAPGGVTKVEIPLIQRDYAQGRKGDRVDRIRSSFLTALHSALAVGPSLDLDFVYGDVNDGVLQPLDGQQRLTTLFLLHWYLGSRTGHLANAGWMALSYATRPSARRFCEQLADNALPDDAEWPSDWLSDQHWYLFPWKYDTTVQGMLVMLDAIHNQFGDDDHDAIWKRLTDPATPAVTFHVLPIEGMGAPDQIYIRMNARGRPLTDFENVKAQLLRVVDGHDQAWDLAQRLDGRWADVMWRLRGDENVFDDEYLQYLRFVMQLCEWRRGEVASADRADVDRAMALFGTHDVHRDTRIARLFQAFDIWLQDGEPVDTTTIFTGLFTTADTDQGALRLFGDLANNVNLFEASCKDPGFGGRRALMLHAVMQHLHTGSDEVAIRLRLVRNLIEASTNEIRPKAMPDLISDVDGLIEHGDLDGVGAFNTAQRSDEVLKRQLVQDHAAVEAPLRKLEDHDLLRGCLMAFALDAETLAIHAESFVRLFGDDVPPVRITGALLAMGDYSRPISETKTRFGAPRWTRRWRELLSGASPTRDNMAGLREVLGALLTRIGQSSEDDLVAILDATMNDFVTDRAAQLTYDWRYYVVRYPAMRRGDSGIYAYEPEARGHSLCMLEGQALHGYYRDAFLHAVAAEANVLEQVEGGVSQGSASGPWFTGYVTAPRWMRLAASGTRMRCVADGFAITAPEEPDALTTFNDLVPGRGIEWTDDGLLLRIARHEVDGDAVDAEDRVQIGASLLAALIGAGL